MKIYFSYKHFPELAGYTRRQRRIIWLNFIDELQRAEPQKKTDFLSLIIIGGLLVGVFGGYFLINESWGVPLGIVVGICVPMFVYQIFHLRHLRPSLKLYMESEKFSFEPVSELAKKFADFHLP